MSHAVVPGSWCQMAGDSASSVWLVLTVGVLSLRHGQWRAGGWQVAVGPWTGGHCPWMGNGFWHAMLCSSKSGPVAAGDRWWVAGGRWPLAGGRWPVGR